MEKKFLLICDNAFIDQQQKLNIMGVFDVINSVTFPAVIKNMFVITGFYLPIGTYMEYAKIKKGSWEIRTPDANITKTVGEKHRFIHSFSNVLFPEEGEYIVEIYINDSIVATDTLYLRRLSLS